MNFVAFRMLVGDRAKYIGLIFAIAFSTFLLQNQTSIFAGLMKRTGHQILDVADADVWVMDPRTRYFDETKPLKDTDLARVRGVEGVDYAVRLFKGTPVARTVDGTFAACTVLGIDEATLLGAPRNMLLGKWEDLRNPNSIIIDKAGYLMLFPGRPLELGQTLELNDNRVEIVGISDALPAFVSFPIIHARYSEALNFQGRQRQQLSYVLVGAKPGVTPEELATRISTATGLKARTTLQFMWDCVGYYMKNTGIPVNFGITIGVGILVGLVVAGQTFYLFTVENLKQFGALKAIGVTNARLLGMILLQAFIVWFVGFAIGTALGATFFEITSHKVATRHFVLLWQSAAGVGVLMLTVVLLASIASLRRVLVLEPATVFRG
ncbi:putative ABC transport system permease protein [Roseimicrobium gellanilyticum]|uniref:Putative ABC transport system permease protein n=1 Tax=Roseimicrobium gellanilyticum TaxID=748857 RepID=A0A366HL54_9BACT|nr:ABC transporter permease [Roseimicrobium gellanilyticum]RBP43668.1 putative ABC transport system permease protein [Roseimicrobium gellanilyticum]